ncbi:hypothetical protein [Lysobacter panacisoli]|uniref:Uncharacterized protein n=1 Tax=Lysobacter panacisoli TaxID=1255263 RepID=A0ABP9LCC8_9GAMM|nr:hypothetical protein [Lysobacter panacisoli]
MEPFFVGMAPEKALELAAASRRAFDLREQRKELLEQSGFGDADALLDAVRAGEVDPDTGYDTWLGMALLLEQHDALRAWIEWRCRDTGQSPEPCSAPLADLLETLPESLASNITVHPDAVSFSDDRIAAIARVVSPTQWALQWSVDGRTWRLDTAPREGDEIATRARLRRPDASIDADPWDFDGVDAREYVLPRFLARLADTPEP